MRMPGTNISQPILTYLLKDLRPSWGAINWAATQELPSISWKPKVQYRVHKSPRQVPILSHINPIHTIPSYLRSILILSRHLRLGLPSGLFPSGFLINILYAFLFSPHSCYMPRSSHPSWLDQVNLHNNKNLLTIFLVILYTVLFRLQPFPINQLSDWKPLCFTPPLVGKDVF
jgi:hypothetical protein